MWGARPMKNSCFVTRGQKLGRVGREIEGTWMAGGCAAQWRQPRAWQGRKSAWQGRESAWQGRESAWQGGKS
eukprot:5458169-Alexandrium_andersonii.AAC.1